MRTVWTLFVGACQWWAGLFVLLVFGWGDRG